MESKLSYISKNRGVNLRKLSIITEIPYTTLIHISSKKLGTWDDIYIKKISEALKINQKTLINDLQEPLLTPFIKWAGGKRQLLSQLMKYKPKDFNTYYEPFIGGGALLLALRPKKAVINDYNDELITTWKTVKNNMNDLEQILSKHQLNDSKEYYLNLRSADRDGRIVKMTDVERAARFIYLNKAGFNGMWRVNSKGQHNIPYGGHKSLNLLPQHIYNDSKYLKEHDIKIMSGDYSKSLENAKKDDFVYMDPPYIPLNQTSAFTNYTKDGFGQVQQEQLASLAKKLTDRGIKVMISNSNSPLIHSLYPSNIFKIHKVTATRMINSNTKKRGIVDEVIITNY